jgi:hypothetical protein
MNSVEGPIASRLLVLTAEGHCSFGVRHNLQNIRLQI